ncbi:MAG: hypothetical protein ACRC1P_06835 [Cellulosilyticaceae bacterium]
MNIQNIVAVVIAGAIGVYGTVAPAGKVDLEKLNEINNNFEQAMYKITELKTNEQKLVNKYNKLYEDANDMIGSLSNSLDEKDKKIKALELKIQELQNSQNQDNNNENNNTKVENSQVDEYENQDEDKIETNEQEINTENSTEYQEDNELQEEAIITE